MRSSYRVAFEGGSGRHWLASWIGLPQNLPRPAFRWSFLATALPATKDLKAIVRVARAMAESGVVVLRYDMTGLGGSSGDFSQTNFTTNLADLRAAIEFAASELGPVTGLLGHSFGGAAALAIAGQSDDLPNPSLSSLAAVATLAAPSDTQHLAALMEFRNPLLHATDEVKWRLAADAG